MAATAIPTPVLTAEEKARLDAIKLIKGISTVDRIAKAGIPVGHPHREAAQKYMSDRRRIHEFESEMAMETTHFTIISDVLNRMCESDLHTDEQRELIKTAEIRIRKAQKALEALNASFKKA